MKTPFMKYAKKAFEFIQDKIICPIPRKLSRDAILGKIEDFAEFFYQKSKDPATMMIVFDLISLGTSTLAQINGLKKSDRENKDYLIQQEMSEAIASLPLTIGLPYFFTKWISRQLESGKVMTKSTRAILDNVIKPYCGVQGKEAFYVAPKLKTKQWLEIEINSILKKLKKTKILPKGLRNRIQVKNINPNTNVPLATLFDLLYDLTNKYLMN